MLAAGTTLGPYKILALLGVGGMGEVYRAHDTRLGRDVAIKVMSPRLAATPEARVRFEREARTISQLNHPHICTLHDIGHQDGTDYLVMELLEGETLAHRLEKGPLPLAEVLSLGMQIADALDIAHRHGIIHRDLKPGNVMLTKSGAKLMDFGLAHASPEVGEAATLAESPTTSRSLTTNGTIVGTFQYMAPEQLEGKEADARTDIWALGCVLYEMATGKRAFEGTSQASLIAAILEHEPRPITELQPMSPPVLEHSVKRCLTKDPADRWQSARDVMHELEWIAAVGPQTETPAAVRHGVRPWLTWVLTTALAITVVTVVIYRARRPAVSRPVVAFDMEIPGDLQAGSPSLSPDGRWLAFAARDSTNALRIWLRPIRQRRLWPLQGTENLTGIAVIWSPDSRNIAFFARGKLMRMPLEGGSPQELCDAPNPRGGGWGRDDAILFAGSHGPILRVSASGGTPVAVTHVDSTRGETSHRYPSFLPDGRRFFYVSIGSERDRHATFLGSLDGAPPRHVLDATSVAVYAPPTQVLFQRGGLLMAQQFDARSGRLKGQPRPLVSDIWIPALGGRSFSVSGNGLLVCATGRLGRQRLYWYDRSGRQGDPASGLLPPGIIRGLSPDCQRVLYCATDPSGGDAQLLLVDLRSGLPTQLSYGNTGGTGAVWSPDGRKVYFTVRRDRCDEIHSISIDGSEGERVVFRPPTMLCVLEGCTPDGAYVVVRFEGETGRWELWLAPTSGEGPARPLLQGPFNAGTAALSPDGRWLAYSSDEAGPSGHYEVYVTTFPIRGVRHRVSREGGTEAVWMRGARELLFWDTINRMMIADVSTEDGFKASEPRELFRMPPESGGETEAPDGNRFLLALPGEPPPPRHITVFVNWEFAGTR